MMYSARLLGYTLGKLWERIDYRIWGTLGALGMFASVFAVAWWRPDVVWLIPVGLILVVLGWRLRHNG